MATIEQLVGQIRTAVYGREVRESIAQGIESCYTDIHTSATVADTAASAANTAASAANTAAGAANTAAANANTAASNIHRTGTAIYNETVLGTIQYPDDAGAYYSKACNSDGIFTLEFEKTRGYAYITVNAGAYSSIGSKTFVLSLTNKSQYAVTPEIMLSNRSDWGGTTIALDASPLYAGEAKVLTIRPSDYSLETTNVYFLFRFEKADSQNNRRKFEIRVTQNGQNAENAENARIAEKARNAGGFYLDTEGVPNQAVYGTASQGGASWTTNKYTHVLTYQNTTATGQYYGRIAWDIKKLFGQGIILNIHVTNQNGGTSGWYFNAWYLSQSPYSWGSNQIVGIIPSDYGAQLSAQQTEFNINIDEAFSDVDASQYDHIYLLVAAYQYNPSNVPANVLSILVNAYMSNSLVVADVLKDFDKGDYYTKEETDELIGSISTFDTDLIFWGDSLTAGAGGSGVNYPQVCAQELGGKTYKNCGVGGENTNTIAARQGGNNILIPAGGVNGTYNLDDLNDIFGYHVNPLRQGNGDGSGNKLTVKGVECTLTITQSSATSTDATYTISGYTGSSLVIPAFARFSGSEFHGKVVVIWAGQNGAFVDGSSGIDARIAILDSMIRHIGHERYIIMGLSSGTSTSMTAEDNALLAHYGNKFFPTRTLLVNYGLTINGLTPTSQDTADIAAGTVPTQLRDDSVHLNAYGYTAVGKMLADKISSLGYFD